MVTYEDVILQLLKMIWVQDVMIRSLFIVNGGRNG